jgi:hypothetical protein
MIAGACISEWYLEQFVDIFATMKIPESLLNAEKIDLYLDRRYNETMDPHMKKNDLLKNGPIRNRKDLNEALDVLAKHEIIWIFCVQSKPTVVELNLGSNKFNPKQAHRRISLHF